MSGFDWHGGSITRDTPVTVPEHTERAALPGSNAGADFVFDRRFMQWIKDGKAKTMGEVADEWLHWRISSARP